MGIDAEEYQKLAYAAGMSGVEMSTLETAAKTLGKSMPEANITDILTELAGMTDESERAAKATELLGSKAAYDLAPMLNAGAEGITAMMQECEDLGVVMSKDTVAAGAALGDTISAVKQSFDGVVNSLGAAVIPIVQKFAELLKSNMPTIQKLFDQLAPVIIGLLDNMLPPLMSLAEALLPVLVDLVAKVLPPITEIATAILPVFVQLLEMILPPIIEIVSALLPVLLQLLQPILALLQPILDLLKPILDLLMALLAPILDLINTLLPPLTEFLTNYIGAIMPALSGAIKAVANVITKVFNVAIAAIKPVIEAVGAVFSAVWNTIAGVWGGVTSFFSGVWEGIKNVFSGVSDFFKKVFGGIGDIIKAPINFVIDALNVLIGALNKISFDIPDWVPAIGGKKFGFDIAKIPHLKNGGKLDGDLFVANEEEPELIASNHDSTVVVNNKQIIAAVVDGVTAAVRGVMQEVVAAVSDNEKTGDIYIPIYLDGGMYDEVVVRAKERINFRSGGRADI